MRKRQFGFLIIITSVLLISMFPLHIQGNQISRIQSSDDPGSIIINTSVFTQGKKSDSVIWDNYEYNWSSTFLVSQLDYEYPLNCQVVDDFILEDDYRVTGVHWWGAFWSKNSDERLWPNPSDFNIIFYADDGTGNMPTGAGTEDPTSTALAVYFMSQVNGTYLGMDRYEYNVSLPTQFNTTSNAKYWIAIQIVLPVFPQWGWATNGDSNPDQLHYPVQGFPLLGVPYWTDTDEGDMAFQLYGGLNIPPPPPIIHGPTTGVINVNYSFVTSPVTDPSGDSLYCRWDWGDGNITGWSGPYPDGSIVSAYHRWTQRGMYEIRAELKGAGGSSGWSDPHMMTIIQNEPPVANFTYTIDELTVIFNASTSYDPDGTIFRSLWDFGDGTEGTREIMTHIYPTSGNYNVTLTVVDYSGDEDTITKTIQVEKYTGVFIFGRAINVTYINDTIIFNAINIKTITFQPFSCATYRSAEQFTVLNIHKGYYGYRFICVNAMMLV